MESGKQRLLRAAAFVIQGQPNTILGTAFDTLLNEEHPLHPVVHIWVQRVAPFNGFARFDFHHCIEGGAVDVCKSLEEGFRVSAGETACSTTTGIHVRCVWIPCVESMWLSILTNDHYIGFFLSPRERRLGPVDLDRKVVLASMADLARSHGSQCPILVFDYRGTVIIQFAPGSNAFKWQLISAGSSPDI